MKNMVNDIDLENISGLQLWSQFHQNETFAEQVGRSFLAAMMSG